MASCVVALHQEFRFGKLVLTSEVHTCPFLVTYADFHWLIVLGFVIYQGRSFIWRDCLMRTDFFLYGYCVLQWITKHVRWGGGSIENKWHLRLLTHLICVFQWSNPLNIQAVNQQDSQVTVIYRTSTAAFFVFPKVQVPYNYECVYVLIIVSGCVNTFL